MMSSAEFSYYDVGDAVSYNKLEDLSGFRSLW